MGQCEIEDWVDEEGAEVFNHEDGTPWDLRAEIFDVDGRLMAEAGGLEDDGGGVGDIAAIAALGDAEPVDGGAGLGGERGVKLTTRS